MKIKHVRKIFHENKKIYHAIDTVLQILAFSENFPWK
jgi:hypothetical protein